MFKLSHLAFEYFNDLSIYSSAEYTLNLLQNEYGHISDEMYVSDIQECDAHTLYNKINDFDDVIVIDFGLNEQFLERHIVHAINMDINSDIVYDNLYERIKTVNVNTLKIFVYFHQTTFKQYQDH